MEGVPYISPTVSDSPALFRDQSATPLWSLGPSGPGVQVRETTLILFSIILDYRSYRLLNTIPMKSLQETRCNHDTEERVVELSPSLGNFTGEKEKC